MRMSGYSGTRFNGPKVAYQVCQVEVANEEMEFGQLSGVKVAKMEFEKLSGVKVATTSGPKVAHQVCQVEVAKSKLQRWNLNS